MVGVKATIGAMPGKIAALVEDEGEPTNILTVLRNFLRALFQLVEELFKIIWPALKTLDIGPIIRVTNLVQDVFIWPIAYLVTCVSIGTHWIVFGQLVVSVQLWRAHKHMKKDDNAVENEDEGEWEAEQEAETLDDPTNDSAALADSRRSGGCEPDDTATGTLPVNRPTDHSGDTAWWDTNREQSDVLLTRPTESDSTRRPAS
jgi:hypothetical protein